VVPFAPITAADNEQEAIKLAIGSQFGLGSSICTQYHDKAERLSNLEVGIVTLNNAVISDQRSHFGGAKKSGFGRVIKIWNARICEC
jgi:acyl-CoA reductase-like NAD-dependent aldehyde dehydrogenase